MNNKNPKFSTCCTCKYSWLTGQDGSHSCSSHLNQTVNRLVFVLSQILNEIPTDKDWLNPDLEQEAIDLISKNKNE